MNSNADHSLERRPVQEVAFNLGNDLGPNLGHNPSYNFSPNPSQRFNHSSLSNYKPRAQLNFGGLK